MNNTFKKINNFLGLHLVFFANLILLFSLQFSQWSDIPVFPIPCGGFTFQGDVNRSRGGTERQCYQRIHYEIGSQRGAGIYNE